MCSFLNFQPLLIVKTSTRLKADAKRTKFVRHTRDQSFFLKIPCSLVKKLNIFFMLLICIKYSHSGFRRLTFLLGAYLRHCEAR